MGDLELAPGFDPAKQALTVTLARIMYPFIVMVSLAALVMGMLNATQCVWRTRDGLELLQSWFHRGRRGDGLVV